MKGNYGIDAPLVVRNLYISSVICLIISFYFKMLNLVFIPSIIMFVIFFAEGSMMIYTSKVLKYKMRKKLVDMLKINGNEHLLDIGCGRGLILNEAAKRLTCGKAIGIDLWRNEDQYNNSIEETYRNSEIEGVRDKIKLITGNMMDMPFEGNMFDLIVSSLAIHNIKDKKGRRKAIEEVYRVLKPGGYFAILDLAKTKEYYDVFNEIGTQNLTRSKRQLNLFPNVWIVSGSKPIR